MNTYRNIPALPPLAPQSPRSTRPTRADKTALPTPPCFVPAEWFTRPNPALDAVCGKIACSPEWLAGYNASRQPEPQAPAPVEVIAEVKPPTPARPRKAKASKPALVRHPETNTPDPFDGHVTFTRTLPPPPPQHPPVVELPPTSQQTTAERLAVMHALDRPDPKTAAARLEAVVQARKARKRAERNEWHQTQTMEASR
jgi:hypothetical protein